ncbi:MAG: hypothetical protein ABI587_16325 [Gemmatimonadales bacterium]
MKRTIERPQAASIQLWKAPDQWSARLQGSIRPPPSPPRVVAAPAAPIRLDPLPPRAAPRDILFYRDRFFGGGDDDDPWGFRGPILGR